VHTVFLLDVDNTLLDNDRFNADLDREVRALLGDEHTARFHAIYEEVRIACGYVDYPETLRRFAREFPEEPKYTEVCALVLGHPFDRYVFPGAFDTIRALGRRGTTVILSDGDLIFQATKIGRSGLARAVDGRVLIYEHKETRLEEVRRRHPAECYVLVDDKPRILDEVKEREPDVVTVFVRQGKYSHDTEGCREPDHTVARIADVAALQL